MLRSLSIWFTLILLTATLPTVAKAQRATPEIRFPEENQLNESSGRHGPTGTHWLDPPALGLASPDPGAVGPSGDSVADQLNRAELNHLLGGGRGPRPAPFR